MRKFHEESGHNAIRVLGRNWGGGGGGKDSRCCGRDWIGLSRVYAVTRL